MSTALMNTEERELLLVVYANLLEANLKGNKTDSVMAKFFISTEEQLKNFEEEYPELILEYYYEKYNE